MCDITCRITASASCFRKQVVPVPLIALLMTLLICVPAAHGFDLQVEPFSGRLRFTQEDIRFDGCRLPLGLVREFTGRQSVPSALGPGWSHSCSCAAEIRENLHDVMIYLPGQGLLVFLQQSVQDEDTGKIIYRNAYLERDRRPFSLVRDGARISLTTPDKLRYHFGAEGRLERVVNVYGNALEFTYADGKLAGVTGPFEQRLEFTFGDSGLLMSAASSFGDKVTYSYDGENRLAAVQRNGVVTARYAYDAADNLVEADVMGMRWRLAYDARNRVAGITNPWNVTRKYEYGRTREYLEYAEIAPNGGRTLYRHWLAGHKRSVTDPEQNTTLTEILAEDDAKIFKVTAPGGGVTEYELDALGRLVEVRHPMRRKVRIKYLGDTKRPVNLETADGNEIKLKYDEFHNVVAVKDRYKGRQTFTYDDRGRLSSFKTFEGALLTFEYADGWLPVRISGPGGPIVGFEYDARGRLTAFDGERLGGRHTLEEFDRRFTEHLKAGLPEHEYAPEGTPVKSADGLLEYVFNPMGRIVSIRFPNGARMSLNYSPGDRLTSIQHPGGTSEEFSYDPGGRVASRKRADGSEVAYSYDLLGRLTGIAYPDKATVSFEFDKRDRVVECRCRDILKRYKYDDRGRVTYCSTRFLGKRKKTARPGPGFKPTVSCEYDRKKDGTETIEIEARGHELVHHLKAGLARRIDVDDAGGFRLEYNAGGRLSKIVYPNGVVQTFTESGPARSIRVQKGGEVLYSADITRNPAGLTSERRINADAESYVYDKLSQLTAFESGDHKFAYAYDAWGNRTSWRRDGADTEYCYLPGGQLEKAGDTTQEWDAHGNILKRTGPEGSQTFEFDDEDRLVSATSADGKTVHYEYDENGLLIARYAGDDTRYFLYDLRQNPLVEFGRTKRRQRKAAVLRRFIYAPGIDQLLGIIEGDRLYCIHRNERNDVVLVTDQDGRVAASYQYDPFGNVLRRDGAFDCPLLFGAHRYEPLFDLYYMRARFYDPAAGRFLSRDHVRGDIEDSLSTNPYLYVRNSPRDFIDPLGLFSISSALAEIFSWGDAKETAKSHTRDTIAAAAIGRVEAQKTLAYRYVKGLREYKKVKVPCPRAANVAKWMDRGYTLANFGMNIVETCAKVENDLITEKTAVNEIITHTVAAELSVGVAVTINVITKGAGAAGPVGIALGLVTTWSVGKVSAAILEGLELIDAHANADRLVRNGEQNDLRLARRKLIRIRDLAQKGDLESLKEAQRLNTGLINFCDTRKGRDMFRLWDVASDIDDAIYNARQERHAQIRAELQRKSGTSAAAKPAEKPAQERKPRKRVEFKDADPSESAALREAIERDRQTANARANEQIAAQAETILEREVAARQAFADGMQQLASGLQQVQTAYQARQQQLQRDIAAQNARMRQQVRAYQNSQRGPTTSQVIIDQAHGRKLDLSGFQGASRPSPSGSAPRVPTPKAGPTPKPRLTAAQFAANLRRQAAKQERIDDELDRYGNEIFVLRQKIHITLDKIAHEETRSKSQRKKLRWTLQKQYQRVLELDGRIKNLDPQASPSYSGRHSAQIEGVIGGGKITPRQLLGLD